MYQEAIQHKDRKDKLQKIAVYLEQDLTLLGCTVIEDSLQKGVNKMISKCLEIGIKVWMITGDKLETAENIGLMAGILNPEMEIFYIDEMDISQDFLSTGYKIVPQLKIAESNGKKTGIIIDMRALGKIIYLLYKN